MRKITLQAGHENAKNNCNPALSKSTGAPGEAEFTVRIRNRLSDILIEKGFQLFLRDSTYNCDPDVGKEDYDLFLAIHYDADIYGEGGGFLDVPDPSTDYATVESQRIAGAMESEYFNHSGIVPKINRRNANTKYYYMWKFLSAKTPCVIIECGVGKDPHDNVILNDTDIVANAIARGICSAFGVAWDEPVPVPPPVVDPPVDPCAEKDESIEELEEDVANLELQVIDLSSNLDECEDKLDKCNAPKPPEDGPDEPSEPPSTMPGNPLTRLLNKIFTYLR